MKWHILCRDCTAENVIEDATEQTMRELADLHREGYPDHRVEFAEMER